MSVRKCTKVRWASLTCLAAIFAATALAACGGGDDSSSTTSGDTTSADTTSAEKTTATDQPTGDPLKILVTSFVDSPAGSVPEIFAGAEVAAENINANGGIAGRPLEVVTCNGKAEPKAETACARKGAEEGVIASDSNVFVADPEGALEILNRADVADVAGAGGQPANFSLPNTYPIDYSAGNQLGCLAEGAMNHDGSDAKLGIYVAQQPFAEGAMQLIEPAIKANPEVESRFVGIASGPVTTQDFGPYVQKLSEKGAEYVITNAEPTAAANVITTASSAGKKWVFCADAGLVGPELLKQLGPLSKAILTTIGYPPISTASENPLMNQFVEEMKAAEEAGNADASLDLNAYNGMRAWFGMQTIAQVAETIKGEITAASFSKAISTAEVDLGYAKINFAKPQGSAPFERVFQPVSYISAWNQDAGELEQVAEANLLELQAGNWAG